MRDLTGTGPNSRCAVAAAVRTVKADGLGRPPRGIGRPERGLLKGRKGIGEEEEDLLVCVSARVYYVPFQLIEWLAAYLHRETFLQFYTCLPIWLANRLLAALTYDDARS